ncbi:MAG: preprotein translocase subunit SecG [Verrucomicrobiales bacterium]|nr:preprotein translocase subunit SecG [Verrucomicrobiales bacterium]
MEILSILLTVVLVTISILIVLIVLLQRPKQEGLGAAFGGSTLDGALGAQTTDVLQKGTTLFAIIFFICSIGLAMVKSREFEDSGAKNVLEELDKKDNALPNLPPVTPGISPNPGSLLPDDAGKAPVIPSDGKGDKKGDAKADKGNGKATEAPKSAEDAKASDQPDPAPKADEKGKAKAPEKGKGEGKGE